MAEWTDDLLTGINEIDKQHMVLFGCLERLEKSVTSDEKWSAVHFALDELSDFARIHFSVEEALMGLHDYPGLNEHCLEHQRFVNALGMFKEQSIRSDVSDVMIGFLTTWLITHIAQSDHAYVPHLRKAALSA